MGRFSSNLFAAKESEVKFHNAEKVLCTLNGVTPDSVHQLIVIEGQVVIETIAAAEEVTLRLRRGTTTGGTELIKATAKLGASYKLVQQLSYIDEPGEGQWSYVLTAEEKAAVEDKALSSNLIAIC